MFAVRSKSTCGKTSGLDSSSRTVDFGRAAALLSGTEVTGGGGVFTAFLRQLGRMLK